jgi:uncharacterized membrane protein YqiK
MSFDAFRAELAAIHEATRREAAAEAEIERRLAAAWFLAHPEEYARSTPMRLGRSVKRDIFGNVYIG